MTAGSKGAESALQLRVFCGDGGKQRPRVSTTAEGVFRNPCEAIVHVAMFLALSR